MCVYEIGFDCCLHLKIAKYYDGHQLAGGRHPMPPASIKRPPQSSRLRPSNPPKYAAVYFGGFSSI